MRHRNRFPLWVSLLSANGPVSRDMHVLNRLIACLLLLTCLTTPATAMQFNIGIDQFDRWIFNRMQTEVATRAGLRSRIELELERIERSAELSESQKDKIRLAGQGDIKRFFDDVAEARQAFLALSANGEIDQAKINEAYQLASPLAQRLNRGLFDDDSLLRKVAAGTVDERQSRKIRARAEQVKKYRAETAMMTHLAMVNRMIPMTQKQREALANLVRTKVKVGKANSIFVTQLITYRLGQHKDALKEILDEAQMKAFEAMFAQARMFKQNLKAQGLLDDDE